jgi:hypothetical protein
MPHQETPDSINVPEAAQAFLDQREQDAANAQAEERRSENRSELHEFCKNFISDSARWRKQSYEDRWQKYRRNAEAVYDQANAARKETWQSTAFVPITPSHVESIRAALYTTVTVPLEVRSRVERDNDQSLNIRDLIRQEQEKSRFDVGINPVLEDATVFGSGFCRIRWEKKIEPRLVRRPIRPTIDPNDPDQVAASFDGQLPVISFESLMEPTVVYEGVRFEHLSIWDIYPDPKALSIPGSSIAYAFDFQYGQIVKMVEEGLMFPEAASAHKDEPSRELETSEKNEELSDRGIAESNSNRTPYGKKVRAFELYARLPKKWITPDEDSEELAPARVIFSTEALMSVEPAEETDGEPPIYKLDYLPVRGQFYGRGIPEMLKDVQEVVNETVNQRIDNVSLVINRGFAIAEKAIVDREDFVSKPGFMVRLNMQRGGFNDIRMGILPLDIPDVTRSAYSDVLEMERYAQERTSANRVTLGTAGLVKDSNQTLGGQELLKQSASEKFAYIGRMMEADFLYNVFKAYWRLKYSNLTPEDVITALGEKRAQEFEILSPEQVDRDYQYIPQGVYTMENKAIRNAQAMQLYSAFAPQPFVDHKGFFDFMAKGSDIDPDKLSHTPEDMEAIMRAQAMQSGQLGPDGEDSPSLAMELNGQRPAPGS